MLNIFQRKIAVVALFYEGWFPQNFKYWFFII
ncbi:MAG: hypothetical protein RLZZ463_6 [Bacteroidota bacterium]|jgi:hypothetical protein